MTMLRRFGLPRTIHEAERVLNRIGTACFVPNRELHGFSNITRHGELNPLAGFREMRPEEMPAHRTCLHGQSLWPARRAVDIRSCTAAAGGSCRAAFRQHYPRDE